jgi:hypothetical protein
VLYTAAALYGARTIVDALREHFGSRTRRPMLKQSMATLGAAELLFLIASRIEAAIRTDMGPTSVAAMVERRAAMSQEAPRFSVHRFPIQCVLVAIAVAAFVLALARPVRPREGADDAVPGGIPRRYAVGVAGATLVCAATIALLVRVHH